MKENDVVTIPVFSQGPKRRFQYEFAFFSNLATSIKLHLHNRDDSRVDAFSRGFQRLW